MRASDVNLTLALALLVVWWTRAPAEAQDAERAQRDEALPSPLGLEYVLRFARSHRAKIAAARAPAATHLGLNDVNEAIVDGASVRVRPLVMSGGSTVLGLLPLLWEAGPGADVSARIAAPVVGGLVSCLILTLVVLPAAYTIWRRHEVRRGGVKAPEISEGTTS